MKDVTEFFRAIVRPYIICSSWTVILLMWLQEMDIPDLLLGAASVIVAEYFGERAVKRFREK